MTFLTRPILVWPAMTLAGIVLGGYVYTAWPETAVAKAPAAKSQLVVRTIASVDSDPEAELSGVAGAYYPGFLFFYEISPTPLLDALITAPEPPVGAE